MLIAIVIGSITACPFGPDAQQNVAMIYANVSNYAPHVGDVVYVTGVGENAQGVAVPGVACNETSRTPATATVVDQSSGAVQLLAAGSAVIRVTCGDTYSEVTLTVLAISFDGVYNGSITGTANPGGAVNDALTIKVVGGAIVSTNGVGIAPVEIPSSTITGESSTVTWTVNNIRLTGFFRVGGTSQGHSASGSWTFIANATGGGTWQAGL